MASDGREIGMEMRWKWDGIEMEMRWNSIYTSKETHIHIKSDGTFSMKIALRVCNAGIPDYRCIKRLCSFRAWWVIRSRNGIQMEILVIGMEISRNDFYSDHQSTCPPPKEGQLILGFWERPNVGTPNFKGLVNSTKRWGVFCKRAYTNTDLY